jgi:acetyl esterase/lipase
VLLKCPLATERDRWLKGSPIHWISADAPPTMIIHGTNDSLVPVEGARRMAESLRAVSKQPVVYAELPYAQHAFDIYASLRTRHTVRAVERFLAFVRAGYVSQSSAVAANGNGNASKAAVVEELSAL